MTTQDTHSRGNNPSVYKSKVLYKHDAKAGHWSVRLAPKARARARDRVALAHMDRIIDQCEGVVGISNDLTVYGDIEGQHDKRLINLSKVARKEYLMLNSSKCVVKASSIFFFGRQYTHKGV